MSHSPEPWTTAKNVPFSDGTSIVAANKQVVVMNHCDTLNEAVNDVDAERIVACVNFCAGLPSEKLVAYGASHLLRTAADMKFAMGLNEGVRRLAETHLGAVLHNFAIHRDFSEPETLRDKAVENKP